MGATELLNLHVWRDERSGQLWRISYNEGDGETFITFPDTQALTDFLAERLGLSLADDTTEQPRTYHSYYMVEEPLDVA